MIRRDQLIQQVLPYIIGFGLSRLMEYPIRLLLAYPFGFLFQLIELIPPEENRKALQEIHRVYLHEYFVQLQSTFYWGLWLAIGFAAGLFALLGMRTQTNPRVFRGFTAALLILGAYGCIILFRGFPYGWLPMDLVALPVFVVAQFYTGILFSRWTPKLYNFLANTRVEELFVRRSK